MNLLNPPPLSLSLLLSSDLVNGLVLLMNSNISSPVNLVSASFSALTFLAEYAVKIGTFKMESVLRGTQRNTPYWSLLVLSKVSLVSPRIHGHHILFGRTP